MKFTRKPRIIVAHMSAITKNAQPRLRQSNASRQPRGAVADHLDTPDRTMEQQKSAIAARRRYCTRNANRKIGSGFPG